MKTVITSRQDQGKDIVVLELCRENGGPLPAFDAGAHVDVHIDNDTIRQYSLSNNPCAKDNGDNGIDRYRIGILKETESRGGSVKIHKDFNVDKVVEISEPRNLFPLEKNAAYSILLGGGIGITPMVAMAYELRDSSNYFELHYCTRTADAGVFKDELAREFTGSVHFHHDDGAKEQLLDLDRLLANHMDGTHIYVCGPSGFMDWVIDSAKQAGYPEEQIHFEFFSSDVDTSGSAFEVHCAQSDITVEVGEQETIVQALANAGIKVNVSCEQGVCGTCITDVLEGKPDHRDQFLLDDEKAENDQMALCCSRAKSKRLVIDL